MKPSLFTLLGIGFGAGALAVGLAIARLQYDAPSASAESFAYRAASESAPSLPELWRAPSFSFQDQHGKVTTDRDLKGSVWIADFIYTSCTNVCPMISAKLALLQRKLAGAPLRFVSFSVDPEHDTPEALAHYADTWNHDGRWLLFSTTRDGLRELAAGMHVAVESTGDAQNPILHSNLFFLVDAQGDVRGVYDSGDHAALDQLVKDANGLLGSPKPVAATAGASGEALFMSLGCAACHDNDRVAPSLAHISGTSQPLAGGAHVTVDAAYLKESIVAPGSKIVAGYLNLMPSYAQDLSDAEIDSLVEYVLRLSANATVPAEHARPRTNGTTLDVSGDAKPASLSVDPVCKMSVRVTASTPHVEWNGTSYYFCSESCRDRFAESPNRYLKR